MSAAEPGERRTSSVGGAESQSSPTTRHLFEYPRDEARAATTTAVPRRPRLRAESLVVPLGHFSPRVVARRRWANQARKKRSRSRYLRHRVAPTHTLVVPSLPMCRPPSCAAIVPRSFILPSALLRVVASRSRHSLRPAADVKLSSCRCRWCRAIASNALSVCTRGC